MGRRFAALFVDWLIAYGLARLAMSFGLVSMASLLHRRAGHLVRAGCGVGADCSVHARPVRRGADGGARRRPSARRIRQGLVRGVLIAVVIPPLITDADLRGLQDKVTNTAVVRR
jgi:hypothetical protein